jgi:phage recombination protein Bet
MNTALAKVETSHLSTVHAPIFSRDQEQMIRDSYLNGASEEEAVVLLEVARIRRLNPLLKQIHFVKRWDKEKNRFVWTAQVAIDGFRLIAERTGRYDGQDEPEFGPMNKAGFPEWAKVKVYKTGIGRPFVGVAYWSEYVQTNRDGRPNHFWNDMPRNQLAKCAESLGLRKAFPEDLGGIYTPEEMGQADNEGPPHISPHGHADEEPQRGSEELSAEVAAFNELQARIANIEQALPMCNDYSKALTLRGLLGSKARPAEARLTRDMQAAKENNTLTLEHRKELSRRWQSLDRKIAKLEEQFKPDLLESFRDPDPEPEADPDREALGQSDPAEQ